MPGLIPILWCVGEHATSDHDHVVQGKILFGVHLSSLAKEGQKVVHRGGSGEGTLARHFREHRNAYSEIRVGDRINYE